MDVLSSVALSPETELIGVVHRYNTVALSPETELIGVVHRVRFQQVMGLF